MSAGLRSAMSSSLVQTLTLWVGNAGLPGDWAGAGSCGARESCATGTAKAVTTRIAVDAWAFCAQRAAPLHIVRNGCRYEAASAAENRAARIRDFCLRISSYITIAKSRGTKASYK